MPHGELSTSCVLAVVWRGMLYGGVTLPVAAGAFGLQQLKRAKKEILAAATDGTQLVEADEEKEEEGKVDRKGKRSGVNKTAQGQSSNKAFKATSIAGQRRRAPASARKQNMVFDPGVQH